MGFEAVCSYCHGGGWQRMNTRSSLFPFRHPSNGRVFLLNILENFSNFIFFFFLFSKNDYGLFSSSTQISNCCFLVGKMCGDCFEPQKKGQSFYTERKLFIIPIMHLSICFPDTHPVHTVRVRSICVLLYPGYPYVSLKAQLHFIFYETFSKSSKKD